MNTNSKKIVQQSGEYVIERNEYVGFNCHATDVSWVVRKSGQFVNSWVRLKEAKRELQRLTATA